jgi:hypothetical protein
MKWIIIGAVCSSLGCRDVPTDYGDRFVTKAECDKAAAYYLARTVMYFSLRCVQDKD